MKVHKKSLLSLVKGSLFFGGCGSENSGLMTLSHGLRTLVLRVYALLFLILSLVLEFFTILVVLRG